MYCSYCGKHNPQQDGRYCSYCGKPLAEASMDESYIDEALQEIAATQSAEAWDEYGEAEGNSQEQGGQRQRSRQQRKLKVYAWLIPLLLALLAGGGLYGYSSYEKLQNDRVTGWHQEAKRQALLGSYDKAAGLLDQAIAVRPRYTALAADRAIVQNAAKLQRQLSETSAQLGKRHIEDAAQGLDALLTELDKHEEPLFEPLHASYKEQRIRLTVLTIKAELDGLDTVAALADKLRVADGLDSDEAKAVRDQIIGKIAGLALKDAERLLQKKSFTDALAAADEGLEYASGNEKLEGIKVQIGKEKKAYEDAEASRMEQAMQKAAEEDLKNRTAAINVDQLDVKLDEYGDLHIHAELTNVATKPVYSVYVEYTLKDSYGNVLDTGTAYATPDYVEPGEKATVDDIYYGAYQNATVRIDRAGWYLD
ncbi:FxLYD domain-containing protein [Paenibacillus sp. MMS18-CY102]|uniref:FxLYD domain-containing protein n=1 Tax=Paenibacillus sp. MMS18-CY102 TaxID=2682849 RepID=UPI0013661C22|nr:hypothetical protein [Paenibacillus sp. MMS18-CY102]